MDPLTRRCMIILSEELDNVCEIQRQIRREVADTRKTVMAMMSAIIIAVVVSGVANVLTK